MPVVMQCASWGEESKKLKKRIQGKKKKKDAVHMENNNMLSVLGAGEKTPPQSTKENKDSFEKCCF